MKSAGEQYVIDDNGKKTGVILSLERYEKLLADPHDLAVVVERREESPITMDEMKRRLNYKDDGDAGNTNTIRR